MKINDTLDITIKDYIGQMEGGVTSVLSIIYDNKAYEGVYWYTEEVQVITFPEDLEEILECEVENYIHFDTIKLELRKSEANYSSIFNELDSMI